MFLAKCTKPKEDNYIHKIINQIHKTKKKDLTEMKHNLLFYMYNCVRTKTHNEYQNYPVIIYINITCAKCIQKCSIVFNYIFSKGESECFPKGREPKGFKCYWVNFFQPSVYLQGFLFEHLYYFESFQCWDRLILCSWQQNSSICF